MRTNRLFHGNCLARDSRLIYRTLPFHHHAVHRNGASRADYQNVAHVNVRSRDGFFFAVALYHGRLRSKVHQSLNGSGGTALRASFKELSQRNEGKNQTRRFKIHAMHGYVSSCPIPCDKGICHLIEADHTVGKTCGRTKRDKCVHIRCAMDKRTKTTDKVMSIDKKYGNAEKKLSKRKIHHVAHTGKLWRNRPAKHVPHGYVKKRNGTCERLYKLPFF